LELFGTEGLASFLVNATDSREDVFMGSFFAEHGIWTSDTRDEQGAWRYGGHGDAEETFLFSGVGHVQPKRLAKKYKGYEYPNGLDGVSAQLVSIHLKNAGRRARRNKSIPDLIQRYHEILYPDDSCPAGDEVMQYIVDNRRLKVAAHLDSTRPSGLRFVFVGDSVDRYQYLSLTYYLRWGIWFGDNTAKDAPFLKNFCFMNATVEHGTNTLLRRRGCLRLTNPVIATGKASRVSTSTIVPAKTDSIMILDSTTPSLFYGSGGFTGPGSLGCVGGV
jgi:hypothetical protein